eukprot:5770412-Pleurochrysis_carterae.AAC.1
MDPTSETFAGTTTVLPLCAILSKAATYCSASLSADADWPSLVASAAAMSRVALAEALACASSAAASPRPMLIFSCIRASDARTRASFLPLAMFT